MTEVTRLAGLGARVVGEFADARVYRSGATSLSDGRCLRD